LLLWSSFLRKASFWPGRKGVTRKKHRPFEFRILGFFSIRIPQSAFRILVEGPSGGRAPTKKGKGKMVQKDAYFLHYGNEILYLLNFSSVPTLLE
jgi:hypothetical protein